MNSNKTITMTTKHTQGPWQCDGVLHSGMRQIKMNGRETCLVPEVGIPNNENEANAKLMAAAPELLEALQVLERMVSNSVRLLKPEAAQQFDIPLNNARQAIKKATD